MMNSQVKFNFIELGLSPIILDDNLLEEVLDITRKYIQLCNLDKIPCVSYWNPQRND